MKILLIENQITQFFKIRQQLDEAGFQIYPGKEEEEVKKFLDLVKIFLTRRYGDLEEGSRRSNVFSEILRIIKEEKPDIIIIDNLLVGYHNAENGIFLAKELRKFRVAVPIIFLSRTEQNNIETMNNLQQITEPWIWIPKGYAGEGILEENYFKTHVINITPLLLEKHDRPRLYIETVLQKFEMLMNQKNDLKSLEESWHQFFKENNWIFFLLFTSPMTLFKDKAFVGGKNVMDEGGKDNRFSL